MRPICTACARNKFDFIDPGPGPGPGQGQWQICFYCGLKTYWGLTVETDLGLFKAIRGALPYE